MKKTSKKYLRANKEEIYQTAASLSHSLFWRTLLTQWRIAPHLHDKTGAVLPGKSAELRQVLRAAGHHRLVSLSRKARKLANEINEVLP